MSSQTIFTNKMSCFIIACTVYSRVSNSKHVLYKYLGQTRYGHYFRRGRSYKYSNKFESDVSLV